MEGLGGSNDCYIIEFTLDTEPPSMNYKLSHDTWTNQDVDVIIESLDN